jgi:hypothetical protein
MMLEWKSNVRRVSEIVHIEPKNEENEEDGQQPMSKRQASLQRRQEHLVS